MIFSLLREGGRIFDIALYAYSMSMAIQDSKTDCSCDQESCWVVWKPLSFDISRFGSSLAVLPIGSTRAQTTG